MIAKSVSAALAIAIALSPISPIQAGQPSTPTTAAQKEAFVREMAPLWLARFDVPSVGIAYIEDGRIAFVHHSGFQSWGFPANEQTLYNVASLTKPVSAEIVMRLVQSGRFSLDAPLADYHIEQDVASDPRIRALTARLVMNHRTGFANWRYETEGVLQFTYDPDSHTHYSGEGYEWMMHAVVKATGRKFGDLARELIFEPVGMELTGYTLANRWVGHIALPYKAGAAVFNVVPREPIASDDLRATAREYAQFVLDVWEGDAVSPQLRRQQRQIGGPISEKPACKGEEKADFCPVAEGWGLGWNIHQWTDRTVLEHSGGDQGEQTFAFYDPGARRGAVILTNGARGQELINRLAGILDGDERFADFMMSPY